MPADITAATSVNGEGYLMTDLEPGKTYDVVVGGWDDYGYQGNTTKYTFTTAPSDVYNPYFESGDIAVSDITSSAAKITPPKAFDIDVPAIPAGQAVITQTVNDASGVTVSNGFTDLTEGWLFGTVKKKSTVAGSNVVFTPNIEKEALYNIYFAETNAGGANESDRVKINLNSVYGNREFAFNSKAASFGWHLIGTAKLPVGSDSTIKVSADAMSSSSVLVVYGIRLEEVTSATDGEISYYEISIKDKNSSEEVVSDNLAGADLEDILSNGKVYNGLSQGTDYIVTVTAVDASGNETSVSKEFQTTAEEDFVKPVLTGTATYDVVLNNITFTWPQAQDENPIRKYKIVAVDKETQEEYVIDDLSPSVLTTTVSTIPIGKTYDFNFYAYDLVGNESLPLVLEDVEIPDFSVWIYSTNSLISTGSPWGNLNHYNNIPPFGVFGYPASAANGNISCAYDAYFIAPKDGTYYMATYALDLPTDGGRHPSIFVDDVLEVKPPMHYTDGKQYFPSDFTWAWGKLRPVTLTKGLHKISLKLENGSADQGYTRFAGFMITEGVSDIDFTKATFENGPYFNYKDYLLAANEIPAWADSAAASIVRTDAENVTLSWSEATLESGKDVVYHVYNKTTGEYLGTTKETSMSIALENTVAGLFEVEATDGFSGKNDTKLLAEISADTGDEIAPSWPLDESLTVNIGDFVASIQWPEAIEESTSIDKYKVVVTNTADLQETIYDNISNFNVS